MKSRLQPEELRQAVLQQEEGEVLRQHRPLVGRALEVDHVVVVADIEGEARHRQAVGPERELQAASDHQVHGGAPIHRLVEELEHEALVHADVLVPEVLAVAEQARALALLDHLGEDIHVGRELARFGAVAAVLVDAELDRVERRYPHVDDELGILRLLACPVGLGFRGFAAGRHWRRALDLLRALQNLCPRLACGLCGRRIGFDLGRSASVCHRVGSWARAPARRDGMARISLAGR